MSSSHAVAPMTEITVTVSRPWILIIDDVEKFLDKVSEFFINLGYDVDTARTPEEAKSLLKGNENKYQIVACDINFGQLSKTKGDRFIIENPLLFGKAKRLIISAGEWLTPERKKQLSEANIAFFEKTSHLNKKLKEVSREENDKWTKVQKIVTTETVPSIERAIGAKVKLTFGRATPTAATTATAPALRPERQLSELATRKMKRTIINWLKSRGSLDEPVFAYGRRVYSANQMIDEVESESEVGFDHVEMLLDEFDYSLETDVDDPQHYDDDEPSK